jgi:pimeloyl-ACP methyl ester carboxylesterase
MQNPIIRDTLLLSHGNPLRYAIYRETMMSNFGSSLIICLHPGWGGQMPPSHYGEQFLSTMFIPAFAEIGATLVSPDCPSGAWNNPNSRLVIHELLDHLIDRFDIDPTQVALVGYSAGGWGAWYLLQESAERFSSAVMLATLPVIDPVESLEENFPKCEELLTSRLDEWLSRLPDLPIYMIHSQDDELLPYGSSRRAYQALVENNRQVEFVTVRGVGHFDGEGYVIPLQESVPWLIDTWKLSKET